MRYLDGRLWKSICKLALMPALRFAELIRRLCRHNGNFKSVRLDRWKCQINCGFLAGSCTALPKILMFPQHCTPNRLKATGTARVRTQTLAPNACASRAALK